MARPRNGDYHFHPGVLGWARHVALPHCKGLETQSMDVPMEERRMVSILCHRVFALTVLSPRAIFSYHLSLPPPHSALFLLKGPFLTFLVSGAPFPYPYLLFFFFFFLTIFIFFRDTQKERVHPRGGKGQKEREDLKQAPRSVQSLTRGLIPRPWDRDLSRNQEANSQQTERPRRPIPAFFTASVGFFKALRTL